jgi:hypothetical protein
MGLVLDFNDYSARMPIPYGLHPVQGLRRMHRDETAGTQVRRIIQQMLGEGAWDGPERLYCEGTAIAAADYEFHNGTGDDAPTSMFPTDDPHPWASFYNARLPQGLGESQWSNVFGIFRTLRTPDYDGGGVQIKQDGSPVPGGDDPRNHYFYKPNPANVAASEIIRWANLYPVIVNWPAWVDWRDYNWEFIPWDDSAYTPRSLSITPTTGGSITPGIIYIRIVGLKGADISGASTHSVEQPEEIYTLAGPNNAIQVSWLMRDDLLTPNELPASPVSPTGYRIYIGTVPGAWLGYKTVASGAARQDTITTLSGLTPGSPPANCTSGLLRQIHRFEAHIYMVPPYGLASSLDRIMQISCADWQWSGYGTTEYRNDMVRFMSPAARASVFTINAAEIANGSFKTFPTDRRNRPNQIIGVYRDLDDPFLDNAQPVQLDREELQAEDRQVKPFTIDFGCAYRSQVQRGCSYWARTLCDMDLAAQMKISPKSYHVLPADTVAISYDVPDWENIKFKMVKKEEHVEKDLGDDSTLQLYRDDLYSDTDHSPVARPIPPARSNPFIIPPVISSISLTQDGRTLSDGTHIILIHGVAQFAAFIQQQRGRVFWRNPAEEKAITVDPATEVFTAPVHGLTNGTPVGIRNSGGVLPSPLSAITTYFIINRTTNTFQLSASVGGATINITSAGTGSNFIASFKQVDSILTPDLGSLMTFDIMGTATGIHQVKVITESLLGASLPFEQHPVFSLTVAVRPSILRVAEPVLVRSSDQGLGFLVGIFAGVGTAPWIGTDLWRDRQLGSGYENVATITKPALGGITTTALPAVIDVTIFDSTNTVRVTFLGDRLPTNCTQDEALAGRNKFIIGNTNGYEIINSTTFTLVSGTTYDMSGLWRGRDGSNQFAASHVIGDTVLLVEEALAFIAARNEDVGHPVLLKAVSFGEELTSVAPLTLTMQGNSEKPLPAVHVEALRDTAGSLGLIVSPRDDFGVTSENWLAEFLSDDGLTVQFPMPFSANVKQAALLKSTYKASSVDRNTVNGTSGGIAVFARSLQRISATENIIEAKLDMTGGEVQFGVATENQWEQGTTIAPDFWLWLTTGNPGPRPFDALDVYAGDTRLFTTPGAVAMRVKIAFIGKSVKFYKNDEPVAFYTSTLTARFPYYVWMAVVGAGSKAQDVMLTTNPFPSTILSAAQQLAFLGSVKAAIRTRVMRHSGIEEIGYGFPYEKVL